MRAVEVLVAFGWLLMLTGICAQPSSAGRPRPVHLYAPEQPPHADGSARRVAWCFDAIVLEEDPRVRFVQAGLGEAHTGDCIVASEFTAPAIRLCDLDVCTGEGCKEPCYEGEACGSYVSGPPRLPVEGEGPYVCNRTN